MTCGQTKKTVTTLALAALIATLTASGGYWAGQRAVLPTTSAPPQGKAAQPARRILYYRNPMGLPDTSPTPKKDPMGMDYIPVYEEEQGNEPASAGQLQISTEKVQKLGVRTEAAQLASLARTIRAAGRIEPDERRIYAISPKFEGYVERLHVNATGQPVGKGQPLFEVYSPELVSAQREYAVAAQGVDALKGAGSEAQAGMKQLAEASLLRLRNWDISDEQLKALTKSGEGKRTLTFRSPVSGVVTEKKAVQGMRFLPGDPLYQVADLSSVWVIADVFEQDIGQVKAGNRAQVTINAYPDKTFSGTVSYVYPTLSSETRTVPVRIELANPGGLLKPGMFAQVELAGTSTRTGVTIPSSAVIDSGTRQLVFVALKEGRFDPRSVRLGTRNDDRVEVLEGVRNGEQVVIAANFLIDAESNLKAAVDALTPPATATVTDRASAKTVGHQGVGEVVAVDAKDGTVSISHAAVASLKWPAMTMEFTVANAALLDNLKPGARVAFEFVERGQGEWVITRMYPAPAQGVAPHAGH